ncbi:flagellar biosynthesis anti-sigma factor FlgM [Aeromonas sp. QDB17]|uniref:flagellar biosynthesis anti-sigma factor FlgM n=1 Tax=Aeromonas sp. QDB17 TaxID=2990485 RepID=UPI0022E17A37|nr:flagellar biosynthesis anti-sigma factor FlgM [Aeromonas sp. QDB17]
MAINNINNLANNRLQNSGSSQGVATKPATSSEGSRATTVKSDSVSLTSEAQQMQKTLNTASTGNESRVESLKKAVASGEYKVNSETVARKMFSFEADLDKRLG